MLPPNLHGMLPTSTTCCHQHLNCCCSHPSSLPQDASLKLYLCVLLRRQPMVAEGIVCGLGGDKFFSAYLPRYGIETR